MPQPTLTRWIGAEGRAFERVVLAFQALDLRPPHADTLSDGAAASGAYVANIEHQYRSTLSLDEVLAVIDYALRHSATDLRWYIDHPGLLTLADVVSQYDSSQE